MPDAVPGLTIVQPIFTVPPLPTSIVRVELPRLNLPRPPPEFVKFAVVLAFTEMSLRTQSPPEAVPVLE